MQHFQPWPSFVEKHQAEYGDFSEMTFVWINCRANSICEFVLNRNRLVLFSLDSWQHLIFNLKWCQFFGIKIQSVLTASHRGVAQSRPCWAINCTSQHWFMIVVFVQIFYYGWGPFPVLRFFMRAMTVLNSQEIDTDWGQHREWCNFNQTQLHESLESRE